MFTSFVYPCINRYLIGIITMMTDNARNSYGLKQSVHDNEGKLNRLLSLKPVCAESSACLADLSTPRI